jgi:hypothetical protein
MLQLEPKDDRFILYRTRNTATRLKRLGMEDPASHLLGKLVRVTGTVERKLPSDGTPWFEITGSKPDQISGIRKP